MAIALGSFAAAANGLASATPAYPASIANNDIILGHHVTKVSGNAPPSFSSMMPMATIVGSSGTPANGSGTINTTSTARIADGTMPANETVTLASSSPILSVLSRWTCAAGKQWQMSNSVATGADTTITLTAVSALTNAIHVQPGDVLVITVGLNDDVPNHTGQDLQVTTGGATLGSITWQTKFSTTTGNDAGMYVGHVSVTGGTAGFCTFTYVATSSVSGNSGCSVTVQRLREQDPALPGVIGLYANPTVQPETHGRDKPVKDANGNWYWIGEGTISYDTNRPILSKSADGGITWKPAHTLAAATATGARDLESCWIVQSGDTMLAFLNRDDQAWCVPWRMSDHPTNPDTFGTTETVDSGMSSTGVIQFIGANKLSTGEIWVFYTGMLSGANNTISYKKRATNGTYGSRLTAENANNCVGASPVTGANDLTYLFYKDLTADTLVYRTLTSGGTLSGATTVASGTAISSQSVPHTNPIYYDDNGTEVIGIAYINDSDILKYREIRNGVLQTEETISSAAITRNPGATDSQSAVASLAVDGTTVHALWSRSADGDLMYDSRVLGTGWGTDTVEWASGGSTGWYVYADVVQVGSDIKLVYIYDQGTHVDDASNNNFNMKQLRTVGGGDTPISGSDSGTMSATETASITVAISASDSGTISATDTAGTIASTLSRTDTGTVSATEATAIAVTLSSTDTGTISATDASTSALSSTATDTGSISATETAVVVVSVSATDTGSISGTDASSSALSSTRTDTGSLSATETAAVFVPISSSDTGSVSATESTAVAVVLSATDTGSISATDSSSSTLSVSVSDTGALSATETASVFVPVSSSDSGTLSSTDTSDLQVSGSFEVNASDSGSLSAVETATNSVSLSRTDTGTISATETAASSGTVTASDTGSISATDTSTMFKAITASDSGTISATDNSAVVADRPGADTGTFSATETSDIVITGTTTVSASDSGSVSGLEESSVLVIISRTDGGTVSATEATAFAKEISVSDSGTITGTESATVGITLSASDSGTLSATESTSISTVDGLPVSVWNGTVHVSGQMKVWNGTTHINPDPQQWDGNQFV